MIAPHVRELIYLADLPKRPILLSGLTELARDALIRLMDAGYEVAGFFDTEHAGTWFGRPVRRYSEITQDDLAGYSLVFCDEGLGHVLPHLSHLDISEAFNWAPALRFSRAHWLAVINNQNFDPISFEPRFASTCYDRSLNDAHKVRYHLGDRVSELGAPYFVNVGAYDCKTHDPCYPFVVEGFGGLQMDSRAKRSVIHKRAKENMAPYRKVRLHYGEPVMPDNICRILKWYRVPKNLALVKIDIDSWDFFILKAIIEGGYEPGIIQIEVNTCFPAGVDFAVLPQVKNGAIQFPDKMSGFNGASLNLVYTFLRRHGYSLVGADFGYPDFPSAQRDAVFVRSDICSAFDLRCFSPAVVMDREPICHTPFHEYFGVDTNQWRCASNPAEFETDMRDVINLARRKDYGFDAAYQLSFNQANIAASNTATRASRF